MALKIIGLNEITESHLEHPNYKQPMYSLSIRYYCTSLTEPPIPYIIKFLSLLCSSLIHLAAHTALLETFQVMAAFFAHVTSFCIKVSFRGTWVAQSVKPPPLTSAQVVISRSAGEIESCIGLCADNSEPAWDSLSPSLSAPPLLACSLSLFQNK